jgi:hypothetical protein
MMKALFPARLTACAVLALVLTALRFDAAQAQIIPAKASENSRAEMMSSILSSSIQDIEGVCLDAVVDGKNQKVYYTRTETANGAILVLKGYVTGVTLFSANPGLSARIENRQLRKQDSQPDPVRPDTENRTASRKESNSAKHRYTLFPVIEGDPISPDNQFCIEVQDGSEWRGITIFQNGYQPIQCTGLPATAVGGTIQFRYAGGDLDTYLARVDLPQQRLRAVADGIARVENAFGAKLVDVVNLLSFKGPDNALTLYGYPQLWFYADTFGSRPPNELRAMAQHETLHLLIDRMGYARSKAVKELFADFLGYGPFSLERFSLLTSGALPEPAIRGQKVETRPILSFINEKNFIPGLAGGHAADSPDEFAASFLHSLLHIELLRDNLHRTDMVMMDGSRTYLKAQVRRSIIEDYIKTLNGFMKASVDQEAPPPAAMRTFFETCLASAAQIHPPPLAAAP